MEHFTLQDWIVTASPFVIAACGFWLRRALNNQDKQRMTILTNQDKQLALIEEIKKDFTGIRETLAAVKTQTQYHHEEISRFRDLVDRWNQGPPQAKVQ